MAMNRSLQHANLALTNPKDEPSSALFPYMIAVAVTVMVIVLGIQYIYLWICRVYFGREPPPEPISGEEIMANLTEEQRRAVLQAILSKVCKAATESDISQRKKKRADSEKDLPITDLEFAAKHKEDADSSPAIEKDDEIPLPSETEEQRVSEDNAEFQDNNDTANASGDLHKEESPRAQEDDIEIPQVGGQKVCEISVKANVEKDEPIALEEDFNISTLSMGDGMLDEAIAPFDIEEGVAAPKTDEDEDLDDEDQESSRSLESFGSHRSCNCGSFRTSPRARRRSTMASVESMEHVCPICLGSYEKGNMLFVSKQCAHIFHVDCILEWLTKNEDCPICREKMVTEDEMVKAAMELVNKTSK